MRVTQDNPTWMKRLRGGDHAAFNELAIRHERLIYGCCHSLGLDADATEDVVGDTLLKVYQALPGFRGESRLSSWVWTIAYRQGIEHLRRQSRYQKSKDRSTAAAPAPKGQALPAQIVEAEESSSRLRLALRQLPDTWATALDLFYWQAKTTLEIARMMKVTAGVVRAYLFRGRKRLKEIMAV